MAECSILRLSNLYCFDSWPNINLALAVGGLKASAKLKSEIYASGLLPYNLFSCKWFEIVIFIA